MLATWEEFQQQRRSVFYPKADLPLPREVFLELTKQVPVLSEPVIADLCRCSLRQEVREVTPLSEPGTFHQLWRVRLASGRCVVFRANALPERWRDYPLLMDEAVAQKLQEHNIPALSVLHVDLSRKNCDTDYAILDEAIGVPLSHWDSDEARMQPLLRELGKFLAQVHQIRIGGYGLMNTLPHLAGAHDSWVDYVHLNLSRHIQHCVGLGVMNENVARRIAGVFEDGTKHLISTPHALLHGDPGSHNVFVDDGEVTCLIDWEDALVGDPVYEIAFWATFHPERRHAAFLEGYRTVADLPDDFELRFWLYFLRVSLAKTVVRDRLGLKDKPGREPAARRVLKGLERLEALTQPLAA